MKETIFDNINTIYTNAIESKAIQHYTIKNININTFKKLITTEYSEAYENAISGNFIYRGDYDMERRNIRIVTPGIRESQNTVNIYTRLFSDILPSWENYPKRNRSFICTSSFYKAGDYSDYPRIVLPKNGTMLGVCSYRDFWVSFKRASESLGFSCLDDFNESFIDMSNDLNNIIHNNNLNIEENNIDSDMRIFSKYTTNDLLKEFNKLDNVIKYIIKSKMDIINDPNISSMTEKIVNIMIRNNFNSILDVFDVLFNPIKNDIKLVPVSKFNKFEYHDNEVWTDSTCIFIEVHYFNSIANIISKNY
jgi:hypothetical protein